MLTEALVPLVTHPNPNSDAIVGNAIRMAAILDAKLHVLSINADIPMVSNALSRLLLNVPAMIQNAEQMSRERGNHLLAEIEKEAGRMGVKATTNAISSKVAPPGDAAAIHGHYCDYVLCGWEANNPTSASTAEAVIFGSGRPAILMPELPSVADLDHVAIAWDGSRAAARAVADAHHLLRCATRISVLTVGGEKTLLHADADHRLVLGLKARGMVAEAVPLTFRGSGIATLLQEQATMIRAGLLIIGAFGHSRAREFILGGTTRGVLDDLRLSVLLSH